MSHVTIVKSATAGAAQLVPKQPTDRDADARERRRVQPEHERPDHRLDEVAAGDDRPDRDAERRQIVTTTMPTRIATPPDVTQRTRESGDASRNSRRPDVSSDAQPATSVAAASPARISPNSTNSSCRNPPTDRDVEAREDVAEQLQEVGRLAAAASMNDLPEPAISEPEQADARCPRRSTSAGSGRPPGPWDRGGRRGPAAGSASGWATWRRCRGGRTPRRRSRTARSRRPRPAASGAQSNWPASGTWFDVQPNQVRFASGASVGIAAW